MGDIRACCKVLSCKFFYVWALWVFHCALFREKLWKDAGFPILSSPSCSKIGSHWVGKLKNPKQWSSCFFSDFCSHTGLDSKSGSRDVGSISFNATDFLYTWGSTPETLKLWCCGCRDTELFALFCYVKKSWTHILPRSPMQQLQMMQIPQPHLLIFAPSFNSDGKCDIYIYI